MFCCETALKALVESKIFIINLDKVNSEYYYKDKFDNKNTVYYTVSNVVSDEEYSVLNILLDALEKSIYMKTDKKISFSFSKIDSNLLDVIVYSKTDGVEFTIINKIKVDLYDVDHSIEFDLYPAIGYSYE